MHWLKDSSIRVKLNVLTVTVTTVALVICGVAFAINDLRLIRDSKVEQLRSVATAIGESSTAAMEFMDHAAAQQLLNAFHSQSTVEFACLYDEQGEIFASYAPSDSVALTEKRQPIDGEVRLSSDRLEIDLPVHRGSNHLGGIYVRAHLRDMRAQFLIAIGILGGVLTGALLLSVLLSHRLQKMFTKPLLELVDVMFAVSDQEDYSRRVTASGRDEFGVLCKGFNGMLSQIEAARADLQQANNVLEDRVIERTAEAVKAKEIAEEASRAKSDFLAKMSHEIRTPMTAILGYADLLQDPDQLPVDRANSVATIRRNGEHLLTVINDILDISKIEAGKMTLEVIPTPLAPMLVDVIDLMRPKAALRSLALEAVVDGEIPETISTDPTRLKQILVNLIGNAVKFTDHGFVRLTVRLIEANAEGRRLLSLSVQDSGIGMSAEQLSHLFQAFAQGDDSMNRRFGGTGLGLAISRSFARMLGGDIQVTSHEGAGSRFDVTIDCGPLTCTRFVKSLDPPQAVIQNTAVKNDSLQQRRVLLVEDGPDNQKLISFMLRKSGAAVTICENGLLGMEAALAAQASGEPFDVIVTDMQMPVMDGYTATTRLRESGYCGPIIALTAHAMTDDCQRCLDAGCDAYSTKPVNRTLLLQLVDDFATCGPDAKWQTWSAPTSAVAGLA